MKGLNRAMSAPVVRLADRVTQILCLEDVSARVAREADPFNLADPCPVNPAGHQVIASCGEAVCCHCAKIFWR